MYRAKKRLLYFILFREKCKTQSKDWYIQQQQKCYDFSDICLFTLRKRLLFLRYIHGTNCLGTRGQKQTYTIGQIAKSWAFSYWGKREWIVEGPGRATIAYSSTSMKALFFPCRGFSSSYVGDLFLSWLIGHWSLYPKQAYDVKTRLFKKYSWISFCELFLTLLPTDDEVIFQNSQGRGPRE